MKIRLDQIVDQPFDWREQITLSTGEVEHPDILELGELFCRGRLAPVGTDHLLHGEMEYRQSLRCTRCLEPFESEVSAEIGFIVRVGGAAGTEGGERELEEEDLGFLRLKEPELETRPLWLEQLQLGVPMKPLCKEDCAGLCSQCGVDLNSEPCACETATDPRWAALAGLRNAPGSANEH